MNPAELELERFADTGANELEEMALSPDEMMIRLGRVELPTLTDRQIFRDVTRGVPPKAGSQHSGHRSGHYTRYSAVFSKAKIPSERVYRVVTVGERRELCRTNWRDRTTRLTNSA